MLGFERGYIFEIWEMDMDEIYGREMWKREEVGWGGCGRLI